MTITQFECQEKKGRFLEVDYYEENFISICIDDNDQDDNQYDPDKCMLINLTVKQAEQFMDSIHRAIIKLEGGKND